MISRQTQQPVTTLLALVEKASKAHFVITPIALSNPARTKEHVCQTSPHRYASASLDMKENTVNLTSMNVSQCRAKTTDRALI